MNGKNNHFKEGGCLKCTISISGLQDTYIRELEDIVVEKVVKYFILVLLECQIFLLEI